MLLYTKLVFDAIAGVAGEDFFAQVLTVEMEIDLGGGYALVTQQSLHTAEVGTALEEVGGKGMTEGVRRYLLLDASHEGVFLDVVEDGDATEVATTMGRDEDIVFLTRTGTDVLACLKPTAKFVDGA